MTLRVLTLLAAAPLMAEGIRAGRGVVKITPPVGIPWPATTASGSPPERMTIW